MPRARSSYIIPVYYHCRCYKCVFFPTLKYWFRGILKGSCDDHIRDNLRAFPLEVGDPWDLVSVGRRPYPDGLLHLPPGLPVAGQHPVPDPAVLQQAMDMDVDFLAPGWPDQQAPAGLLAQAQPAPSAADAAPVDLAAIAAAEKGGSGSASQLGASLLINL